MSDKATTTTTSAVPQTITTLATRTGVLSARRNRSASAEISCDGLDVDVSASNTDGRQRAQILVSMDLREDDGKLPFVLRSIQPYRDSWKSDVSQQLGPNVNRVAMLLVQADHKHPVPGTWEENSARARFWVGLEECCPFCHTNPQPDLVGRYGMERVLAGAERNPIPAIIPPAVNPHDLAVQALSWITLYLYDGEDGAEPLVTAQALLTTLIQALGPGKTEPGQ